MDKPRPVRLSREQLGTFLRTPELIRAFEAYIKALADIAPDEINALRLDVATAAATVNALLAGREDDRQAAELARVVALSGQVEQLREQLAALQDNELLSLRSQINELREGQNMGQRIRRIVGPQAINISSGNLSATYVITPGITGPAELRFLGANSDDVDCDGANVSVTRAGDTITATRNATGFATRAVFELTEYYP